MAKSLFKTPRGVLLVQLSAVFVVVAIVAFIGFNHVNSHQKLASGQKAAPIPTKEAITADDIRPITNETSMDEAVERLATLDKELDSDTCAQSLISEIDSITN